MNEVKETLESCIEFLRAKAGAYDPKIERNERWLEAREMLEVLPTFARCPAEKLRSFVREESLRRRALAWQPTHGSLLIVGPTGAGKTSAAALIFRRLVALGVERGGEEWETAQRLVWSTSRDLTIAERAQRLGRGEPTEIVAAKNARVLFLDDIGWEHEARTIGDVLEHRYSSGRPTIATSGHRLSELDRLIGEAPMRKLLQSGTTGQIDSTFRVST